MGASASGCCNTPEATTLHEQKEITIQKEPAPGSAGLPDLHSAPEVAAPSAAAKADPAASAPLKANEYSITLDKSSGNRLGIDVDHQDGQTLLVECINPGLVQDWNDNNAQQVQVGDRIVEVNGMRDDVLQLVDECKKNQVLLLKVRRA
mmetsp:Transcript_45644/g.74127  ORF Transcript_45644/g.74127 Transcript_45644/m.74127 type:complete len:149 (-) Transcript_45644:106-552(-)